MNHPLYIGRRCNEGLFGDLLQLDWIKDHTPLVFHSAESGKPILRGYWYQDHILAMQRSLCYIIKPRIDETEVHVWLI